MKRMNTRRAVARFLLLLLLPALALPAAGCTLFPIRGRQVLRALRHDQTEAAFPAVGTAEFEAALDARLSAAPAHPESRAKLLQNGDEAYPVMLKLISEARERISLEMYIVDEEPITDEFFEALKAAAARGVHVRLMVDAAGYQRHLIARTGELDVPNLEARIFNPFFLSWTLLRANNRDHRKILVVDGRYAVMGGINISKEQLGDGVTGWRDTALLVEGDAAGDAERIFAETWEQGGRGWLGKTLPVPLLNPIKKAVDAPFQLLGEEVFGMPAPFRPEDDPERPAIFPEDFYDTARASVRAIGSSPEDWASATHDVAVAGILGARERVDAAYAYFVPPREVLAALLAAAERGVKVRLLLPGVTDVRFVREIGMKQYGKLLEAGVEIHEWPHPILHSKTMAVDGKWLLAGSANMDSRSYFLNYEAVFAVTDADLAEAAHRQFEADLRESAPLTLEQWQNRGLKQRLLEIFLTPVAGQF